MTPRWFRLGFQVRGFYRWLPNPRWLRRWYYRKFYQWWGHPSNHHWKHWELLQQTSKPLGLGERDIWTGGWCSTGQYNGEPVLPTAAQHHSCENYKHAHTHKDQKPGA